MTYYKPQSGGVKGFLRRNANTISLAVIALSIIAIFLLQAMTISQLQTEVEHQTKVITEVSKLAMQMDKNANDRTTQINDINKHLDCIVQFFAEPNRSQKSIEDIDKCRISTAPVVQTTPQTSTQITKPTAQVAPKKDSETSEVKTEEKPTLLKKVTNFLGGLL